MKTSTYFNTTVEKGTRLIDKINMCKFQDEIILEIVKDKIELSAWGIYNILNTHLAGHYMLITSIRRGLNTLQNAGKIYRTDNRILENTGGYSYTYKIKESL